MSRFLKIETQRSSAQFLKGETQLKLKIIKVTLLDTSYRVMSLVVVIQLEIYAKDIIGKYQCGYVREKLTTDHIFSLRQIMEKYYEYDKDLFMILIDFKQSYDHMNRPQLWTTLTNFDIPEKLVKIIEMCNSNTFYKVRDQGKLSLQFKAQSGLKQSDTMFPMLFNLGFQKSY